MAVVACLAGGGVVVRLAAVFTLAWTHSVQRTEWRETWRATPAGLELVEVRVEGSGAGMEPPDGAELRDGFYVAHPRLPAQPEVLLRRSGATADWRVCVAGSCRPVGALLPEAADPVRLATCD
ncbi:DUF1850 domain-containing protein [Xanthobacter sp. V4C-4]|uniref:DUF1850 domain-containing protein n=1 Tax=Xanthobacter cornucopiae TaxID=3119924 RepID=UPI0037270534